MSFTVIDWIFSVLIVLLAFNGLFKGFIENVFGKLALILGILFACMFYKKVVESLFKAKYSCFSFGFCCCFSAGKNTSDDYRKIVFMAAVKKP